MKFPSRSGLSVYVARVTTVFARIIAHRTKTLIFAALAIAALSIFIITKRQNFDSEVLDLLPSKFESVVGLKEFNSEFAQARQLVFGFLGENGHPDDVEAFRTHFMEELGKQPWVLRTFDRIPLETQEGLDEIQGIVPALLLNLPPDEFKDAMAQLQPGAISERLTKIRDTITGDSIRTQLEATLDPLGLFARAMKPFGSSSSMDQGSALASENGLFQIALVITNQPRLDPRSSQAMMEMVSQFTNRMLSEWTSYKPKVYVTGRTAFVAQISHSMEGDLALSAILSIGIVSGLFYIAFRRFLPLIGIVLILCLSALVALALGMLIFHALNVVAIGFFSILAGVGVDFSLLLFGRYQQAGRTGQSHEEAVFVSVRDIGAAIFYVVLTTAIGFLVLKVSQSSGFAQLGTLVALGVGFAGLFMVLFLFMFFRRVKPPKTTDFILIGTTRFVDSMFREPRPVLAVSLSVLIIGALIAVAPFIPLKFDTNPVSLQPKKIPASIALQVLSDQMKQESDPVTILVNAKNQEEFHDRWEKLSQRLEEAQKAGELKSVSLPVALALSPARIKENRETLRKADFNKIKVVVRESLERNGFELDSFKNVFELLDRLQAEQSQTGLPDWSKMFPPKSSWWFLIDRYFADKPGVAAGYVQPNHPIHSQSEQRKIGELIHNADPHAMVTGWSYTLWDLIPWAEGELVEFTTIVGLLILTLLWVVYRRFSLWLVHASALTLSMLGLVASLKLFHVSINLLNTLAFPLVLAIGVDYGIQFLVVSRREGDLKENLANVLKPLSICGLTTFSGFAVLIPAQNPALSGLGLVCAIGVFWCLLTTFFYMVPAFAFLQRRRVLSGIGDPTTETVVRHS
ncbi:MAG: MMPL family transporter, partial [Verrucomicrobia bacterium]|nr:MMPL family transporter [Verrucomicrobiota bacterium]